MLGIVGIGSISRKLAGRACHGLGIEVHYYDVVRAPAEVKREVRGVIFHNTLKGLFAVADCVSVHVSLTLRTRVILSEEEFAAIKDGTRLVNTA